jgi:DNA mismatch repair ATPase MutL
MTKMRMTRFLNTAVLSALVATSAAMYAQDEKPQEPKPPRQEEPRPEPKQQEEMKAPKQNQMKPAQQGDMKPEKQEEAKPQRQEESKPQEEAKPSKEQQKQQEKQTKEQMKQDKNHEQPAAAQGNETHAGGAVGHPQGKSGHIPDDKFKSNFGHSHTFVVQRTTVVQGQPGFVYGGYSFVFVDAWPADWAYTDDCYVDYIDGEYFLFNVLHPGIRIALFVVL